MCRFCSPSPSVRITYLFDNGIAFGVASTLIFLVNSFSAGFGMDMAELGDAQQQLAVSPAIELIDVTVRLGHKDVLRSVSVSIARGGM